MSQISILLMMIVDTVAQVAAKGQWTPYFNILSTSADLYFRPASWLRSKADITAPLAERHEARITTCEYIDEQEQLEKLQAMLAFARRHLDNAPEA